MRSLRILGLFGLLGAVAGIGWGQTLTLGANPNPSTVGTTVVLTATASQFQTAVVTFRDGNNTLGTSVLAQQGNGGVATFQAPNLAVGSHNLSASYQAGSSTINSNIVVQTVNPAPSVTSVVSSGSPSTYCGSVTFTATVGPATSGAALPAITGTVTFSEGSTTLGPPVAITNNTASLAVSNLTGGTHTITATYSGSTAYASSSGNVIQNVNKAAVSATILGAPNPSTFGQNVAFTTTLSVSQCPAGPTGTVTVFDGSTSIGQSNVANLAAVFQTTTLSVGSHGIDSHYSGDTNYNPIDSKGTTQVVNPATSTTSLNGAPNPSTFGQPVILTATVTPNTATGTVTFFELTTQLGQGTLANGLATFQTSTLAVGSHQLTARYAGNQSVAASTSTVFTQVVNKANTTTTLTPSANPIGAGLNLTLTAVVTPASATGQVQFRDGATVLGTGTLANGTTTFTTTLSASGSPHSLTAVYQGDNTFNTSTSTPVSETVNAGNTTITLQVSPNPATVGATVSMSAVVQPTSATGTVSFRDGGVLLQNIALNGGTALFSTTALTAGNHTITAQYNGDSSFNGVTSSPTILVVNPNTIASTTALAASASTAPFGQSINLTATISVSTSLPAAPGGNVTFNDGSTNLGTVPLTGNTAVLTTSTLPVGAHTITATYSGDTSVSGSTSSPVAVTITQASTTTVLTINPASSTPGQSVVLTARVNPAAATGNVTFREGTTSLGSSALTAGTASISLSTLSTGTHTIAATYGGDTNFATSTSTAVTASVGLTPTTTTLATSPAAPAVGDAVTLTATVTPAGATGSVSFLDGTATLGSGNLNAAGVATFTTSALSGGTHSITAVYSGDTRFATSTSTAATVTVGRTTSRVVLSVSPNPANAGQNVTLTATVTPATATGTVTFLDSTTTLGTATLAGGVATFSSSTLTSGNHSLTASYGGDNSVAGSTSAAVALPVGTVTPLGNIAPTSLPTALLNVPYSQTFTVAGGTAPFTWTIAAGNAPGITMSQAGVLAGTPTTAGTFSLTIRVVDARGQATATVQGLTVVPQPAVTISVTQPASGNATAQVTIPTFPVALDATFAVSFTPNGAVKGLPAAYTNPDVVFTNGNQTISTNTVPANSAPASFPLPVQLGSVAGVITVRLASLTSAGQPVPLPNPVPSATVTVNPGPPTIASNSVKITGVTASGFQVVLSATSLTREVTGATLNFTAAPGTQLNGSQQPVSLTSASAAWFTATNNASLSRAAGGSFTLTMSFPFSGDTSSIGGVSVTLSNSVGPSAAVTGGR